MGHSGGFAVHAQVGLGGEGIKGSWFPSIRNQRHLVSSTSGELAKNLDFVLQPLKDYIEKEPEFRERSL